MILSVSRELRRRQGLFQSDDLETESILFRV
jgi:hypothetical protein